MNVPWLTLLILAPILGALVTPWVPRAQVKIAGLGFAGLTAVFAVGAAAEFYSDYAGFQLTETHTWIEPLGVHYALGLDGLGLLMVLLTVVLVPIVFVAAWPDAENGSPNGFVAWTLALQAMSLIVFTATDVFLFYVAFEATLIPAYFLIAGFGHGADRGSAGRSRAAVKFLLYQLAGGLIMLASVIGLYVQSGHAGTPSYLITDLAQLSIDPTTEKWLFAGFFLAFAIKAPMFPVHTWLADTTEKTSTGVSVLLVCILDKIGTFGMLRFCLGLFPEASQWATPFVVVLALISIVYGALVAIGQDDVLRLIGLTSLSHFGFIVLGIFVFNANGGAGAVLYMVNHGIGTAALFLIAGFLIRRTGTASIREMSGLEKSVPILAGFMLIAGLAACGLPGLSPFVSETLVIIAAFDHAWWAGAVAVTAIVLAAIYILWLYQRTMTGPREFASEGLGRHGDLSGREIGAVGPLLVALVVFGFFPMPILNVVNPYVDGVLTHVGVTEPGPTVPAVDGAHDDAAEDSQHTQEGAGQ